MSCRSVLPSEILSQIFLEVDPHTLYTSVRSLSRSWKQTVEDHLLAQEFRSGNWKLGLRVVRKPKVGARWRGGRVGGEGLEAPGATWHDVKGRIEDEAPEEDRERRLSEAKRAYADATLIRYGAWEDDLTPLEEESSAEASHPLVHVIPLTFKKYDGASTTLQFGTKEREWHALFEQSGSDSGRLDLDFGLVWRFPGDGQDHDGWGTPDAENGWLSRFYCSNFDVRACEMADEERVYTLQSSPLARRIRSSVQQIPGQSQSSLEWSDEGHEYVSLSVSLGTEFFVRRSARANYLLRRLEIEAKADEERQNQSMTISSVQATPVSTPRNGGSPATPALSRHLCVKRASSLQHNAGSAPSSGATTPLRTFARSFAAVASTPPTPVPKLSHTTAEPGNSRLGGSNAPLPSVHASGYSSVQHRPPVDGKEMEGQREKAAAPSDEQNPTDFSASETDGSYTPSTKGYTSKVAISSHYSVPRAHFCATLVSSNGASGWHGGDQWGRNARSTMHGQLTEGSLWEWRR